MVPRGSVIIYCDSIIVLAYSKDLKYHEKSKHIQMRYHFVRDMIAQKQVVLIYMPTGKMVVDPLTKPIARVPFESHVKLFGLCRI
jgi:hypothetical protein